MILAMAPNTPASPRPFPDPPDRLRLLVLQGPAHRRRDGRVHRARRAARSPARSSARELGLHPRGISDFFDALVAMKFLDREGDGPDGALLQHAGRRAVTSTATSPRYVGGILEMLNARLFKFWHDLPEALRTGKPQNEIKHSQKPMFEELYSDLPRLEQFMGAMTGLSRINFEAFAEKFDFTPFKTLCDVGGATGLLVHRGRQAPPAPAVHVVRPAGRRADREEAHRRRRARPTASRTASGDFFKDPLPKADLITMGMILHDWNLEKKMHLIRAAYDALPPGGAFVAIEALIDDDAPRERVRPADVAEHADRVRRRVRLLRRRLPRVVRRGRVQALRGDPPRRPVERGDRLQVEGCARRAA